MENKNMEKMWQRCLFRIQVDKHIYNYIIIKSNIAEDINREMYGVKIQKNNYKGEELESKIIENISPDKNRTTKIISLLKRFKVTPITLEDVIVDNI